MSGIISSLCLCPPPILHFFMRVGSQAQCDLRNSSLLVRSASHFTCRIWDHHVLILFPLFPSGVERCLGGGQASWFQDGPGWAIVTEAFGERDTAQRVLCVLAHIASGFGSGLACLRSCLLALLASSALYGWGWYIHSLVSISHAFSSLPHSAYPTCLFFFLDRRLLDVSTPARFTHSLERKRGWRVTNYG